jgi:2,3-bisphosphoglycerate-independent phosphoglycerate mutase
MQAAQDALADCELNSVRRDLGENPITGIWLWGEGPRPRLPIFRERFGVSAVAMGDNAVFRGLARSARVEVTAPAPSDLPNSLTTLCTAARDAVDRSELVIVHAAEADAAGHAGDPAAKVAALERLDGELIAPLLATLQSGPDWRILILTACTRPRASCGWSAAAT